MLLMSIYLPVQYTQAARSAFAYERPAFAYVIISPIRL